MNNVYYLIHRTNYYDDSWTELKPSKIENYEHQFPGVYLSIITKNTIETIKYNCKYILIFSIKLLKQKNFHINIKDYNGFINENNTYFYWDLNKALEIKGSIAEKDTNAVGQITLLLGDTDPFKKRVLVTLNTKLPIAQKIGDTVIVKGKCTGNLSDVVITEAIIK